MPLSPSGRARARRWDKSLDRDRAAHRPDRNRDRAARLEPSHQPGSLPNAHNGRVTPAQPNQHTTPPGTPTPPPPPAARPDVAPGAPPAPPTHSGPAAAGDGGSGPGAP
jgi:hypothetical protein